MRLNGAFFRSVAAGLLIGIGCVLPGVSGGVMAVSFGLYRPMLDAVLTFFKDTRKKIVFLLPLALGGGLGLLLGAKGLSRAMALYEPQMLMLFTGFILGGVPDLMREAEGGGAFDRRWLLSLALGVLLALPMALCGGGETGRVERLSMMQALGAGVLEGVGTVVPGLSTSFLLIHIGWYQAYLAALSGLQAGTLCLIGLGFLASALLCMKGVKWLFDHAQGHAYYAVLGFLLVSVALVFPGFHTGRLLWADIGLIVFGAVTARWLSHMGSPVEREG